MYIMWCSVLCMIMVQRKTWFSDTSTVLTYTWYRITVPTVMSYVLSTSLTPPTHASSWTCLCEAHWVSYQSTRVSLLVTRVSVSSQTATSSTPLVALIRSLISGSQSTCIVLWSLFSYVVDKIYMRTTWENCLRGSTWLYNNGVCIYVYIYVPTTCTCNLLSIPLPSNCIVVTRARFVHAH